MFQNNLAESTVSELRNWFKNSTDGHYGSQFSRELIERFEELIVERKRLTNEARRLRDKYNKLWNWISLFLNSNYQIKI